jgi:hypothetical protein
VRRAVKDGRAQQTGQRRRVVSASYERKACEQAERCSCEIELNLCRPFPEIWSALMGNSVKNHAVDKICLKSCVFAPLRADTSRPKAFIVEPFPSCLPCRGGVFSRHLFLCRFTVLSPEPGRAGSRRAGMTTLRSSARPSSCPSLASGA